MNQKIEKILLYLFYAFTLLAVILYFACSDNRVPFYYCGTAAIAARAIHYMMKYLL